MENSIDRPGNVAFARHPSISFVVMERITLKNESMEIAKSAAPIATLPHEGRYCRINSNFDGISNIPCASRDVIPAMMRWVLLDNDEGILFISVGQKVR